MIGLPTDVARADGMEAKETEKRTISRCPLVRGRILFFPVPLSPLPATYGNILIGDTTKHLETHRHKEGNSPRAQRNSKEPSQKEE